MKILCLARVQMFQAVQQACSKHTVEFTGGICKVLDGVAPPGTNLLVVDPGYCEPVRLEELVLRFAQKNPTLGVLVVGELTPRFAGIVRDLAECAPLDVALPAFDAPQRIWSHVRKAYLRALPYQLQHALYLRLRAQGADDSLSTSVAGALTVTPAPRAMPDLARLCGVSTRTLYRQLGQAGLPKPKDVLRLRRVVHSLPDVYTVVPLSGSGGVAARHGFAEYSDYQTLVRRFCGASPRVLRHRSEPHHFAPALLDPLFAAA